MVERLERRYRRLLYAYPAEFRRRRGDELVTTLMDCSAPGQRLPRPKDAADLVTSGLRHRCGLDTRPALLDGLATAAPIALALAAGLAIHLLGTKGSVTRFDTGGSLGPPVYAAWTLAAVAAIPPWRTVARGSIGLALTVTVVAPALGALTSLDRPPLWISMALAGFGLIALTGTAPAAGTAGPRPIDVRLAVPAGAIAFAATAWAVTRAWPPGTGSYYAPLITRVGAITAATVLAIVVIAAVRPLTRRVDGDRWLWAAVILGAPASWIGPFGDTGADGDVFPHFGRLAQVLLALCAAAATIGWLAGNRTPRPGRFRGLPHAGAAAIGCAAGLATGLGVIVGGTGWPATVTLFVLAVVGLVAWAPTRTPHWGVLAASAGATIVAVWLIAVYDNDWSTRGWNDPAHTASLAATAAFVPLTIAVVTAARALRRDPTRGARWRPVTVLVTAVAWLGFWTLPHLPSWGPALAVFAVGAVMSRLARSRT